MKKNITVFCLLGIFSSCASNSMKFGVYSSKCRLYDTNALKLHIKTDYTFQYFFAYNDEVITGKWEVKKDTLFLFSEKFLEKREPLSPTIKNSDLEGNDVYIMKGRTLKLVKLSGVSEDCPLILSK